MIPIPQSTAFTVVFKAFLSSDHVSEATSKTIAITISKAGGAFGNPNAGATNATEIANGWYKVALDTTDTNTLGIIAVRGTAGTIDDVGLWFGVVKATNGGLTALPDTAATTNASLITSGTGTDQLSVASGRVDLGKILGTASAGAVGYVGVDWGQVTNKTTSNALTGTTIATTQQVDVNTIKTQTVTCGAGVTVGAFVGNATAALSVDASGRVDIGKALGQAVTLDANNVLNVSAKYWAGGLIPAPTVTGVPNVNTKTINDVATTSVTTIGANLGTTQPLNFTGTGASALVKTDMIDVNSVAYGSSTLNTLASHDPGATIGTSTLTQTQVTGGAYTIQSSSCVLGDARIANLDATVSSRLASGSYTAPDNATIATINTNVSTLLSRITSTLFNGITSLKEWLGLIAGKQTGNSTARTELRATGAGSGTYDETTDSLEAVRDRGDAAWITATGFSTHTAADVWAVATRALTDKAGFTISGTITTLDALATHGDSSWATADVSGLSTYDPDVDVVEDGETFTATTRLIRASALGLSNGFPDGPAHFRDRADTKDRITATIDSDGNRTTITTDAS